VKDWAYQLDHDRVVVSESRLPAPVLTYLGDGRWRLEQEYEYRDGDTLIAVPAGFEFDLSSVPRVFWTVIAPFELSVVAPLVHDFLYRYGGDPPAGTVTPPRTYTRAEADRLFRVIMRWEGVPVWRRVPAYLAVRLFGRSAWRS
jgi:hypothetical protein